MTAKGVPSAFLACLVAAAVAPSVAPAGISIVSENEGGWLGVIIQDLNDDMRESMDLGDVQGVLVNDVSDDSPAEKAGIKEGDVITALDGERMATTPELVEAVRSREPGTEVKLSLVRDGTERALTATLAERPGDSVWTPEEPVWIGKGDETEKAYQIYLKALDNIPRIELGYSGLGGRGRLGVFIGDLSEGLAEFFGVPDGKGVLVEDIVEDSPAEKAGIKPGDVIIKVGNERVADSGELVDAIREMKAGEETPVVVIRKGQELALKATVGEDPSVKLSDEIKSAFAKLKLREDDEGDRTLIVKELSKAEDDLRAELEELREQLEELREELRDLRSEE